MSETRVNNRPLVSQECVLAVMTAEYEGSDELAQRAGLRHAQTIHALRSLVDRGLVKRSVEKLDKHKYGYKLDLAPIAARKFHQILARSS